MVLPDGLLNAGRFGLVGFLAWRPAELIASLFGREDVGSLTLVMLIVGYMLFEVALLLVVSRNQTAQPQEQPSAPLTEGLALLRREEQRSVLWQDDAIPMTSPSG